MTTHSTDPPYNPQTLQVEDVGKTVKASKRRARWTFSFGAQGPEHVSHTFICLIDRVVSILKGHRTPRSIDPWSVS